MTELTKQEKLQINGGLIPVALVAGYIFGVAVGGGTVIGIVEGLKWWIGKE
jgi:lactobin A/cerein 7B family class IIb bacteriocin